MSAPTEVFDKPSIREALVSIRVMLDEWRDEIDPEADSVPRPDVPGAPPRIPRPSLTLIQGGRDA